jgi:succinyl-CoA synthetase beta subunit
MLKPGIKNIIEQNRKYGWIMEPEAMQILTLYDIPVPHYAWTKSPDEALRTAKQIGYPLVAKIVSPKVIHKSDVGGVIVGIRDDRALEAAYQKLEKIDGFSGVMLAEMVQGLELILGAKMDYQFGPVILLGMGGTGVEIYQDAVLRMAPLKEQDVLSMLKSLKAHKLLEGYRGALPVDITQMTRLMLAFSQLVMDLAEDFESIDINPLKCLGPKCLAADGRIMLKD